MEENTVNSYISVVAGDKSATIAQPCKRAFDFVASFVAAKFSAILRWLLFLVFVMRANKFYATLCKTFSQWIPSKNSEIRLGYNQKT